MTLGENAPSSISVNIPLHPKPGKRDRVVERLGGVGGCPWGVILPYYVTLYEAPTVPGGVLTKIVTYAQEGCAAGETTLERVAPGTYVVEIDSRAVTPRIYGTAPVIVVAGEDVRVHLNL